MNFSARGFSIWKLPISPSMALALALPSIGYYTFATHTSLLGTGTEESWPAIAIRAVALFVLGAAFFAARRHRTPLPIQMLPGLLFVGIYLLRMLENDLLQGVILPGGSVKAVLIFIFSAILTALVLSSIWRALSARDCRIVFSVVAIFFVIGALLSVDNAEITNKAARLWFTKVNAIALAQVCSAFIFYYLLIAQKNWRSGIEAAIMIPVLIIIAMQAQSRGMIISSAICLLLYIATRRGKQLFLALGTVGLLLGVILLTVDYHYFELALGALQRIDNDNSTATRVLLFRGAFEQFLTDPLFGRYVTEQTQNFYPHNIYLESLMAVGFIGSIPFFLHFAFASIAAFSILRLRNVNWVWTFIALMFFREAMGGAALFAIHDGVGLWITSFLVIAIWHGSRRNYGVWQMQTESATIEAGTCPLPRPTRRQLHEKPLDGLTA